MDPLGLESFPFQGYVPPVAVTGAVDSSGNFYMTGAEAINPGTFPGAAKSLFSMNTNVLGADSTTGPQTFYEAGTALILTGSEVTKFGVEIMATGGPVGWIGGGIVTGTGVTMTGFGAWTFYQGWKITPKCE